MSSRFLSRVLRSERVASYVRVAQEPVDLVFRLLNVPFLNFGRGRIKRRLSTATAVSKGRDE